MKCCTEMTAFYMKDMNFKMICVLVTNDRDRHTEDEGQDQP